MASVGLTGAPVLPCKTYLCDSGLRLLLSQDQEETILSKYLRNSLQSHILTRSFLANKKATNKGFSDLHGHIRLWMLLLPFLPLSVLLIGLKAPRVLAVLCHSSPCSIVNPSKM